MNSMLPTAMILTLRQRRRLGQFEDAVQSCSLDAERLLEFIEWMGLGLSFHRLQGPLRAAVKVLIKDLEEGEYEHALYREVGYQIDNYKRACWTELEERLGSAEACLDEAGNVLEKYQFAFRENYGESLDELAQKQLLDAILDSATSSTGVH